MRTQNDFIRWQIARGAALTRGIPAQEALRRSFGEPYLRDFIVRAGVPGLNADANGELLAQAPTSGEWVDTIDRASAFQQLPGKMRGQFRVPYTHLTTDLAARFISRGTAIRAYAPALNAPTVFDRQLVAGLFVIAKSVFEYAPLAEQIFTRNAGAGVTYAIDQAVFDPANTGTDGASASITSTGSEINATGAASIGDVDGVIGDMVDVLISAGCELRNARLAMNPALAAALSMMRDPTSGAAAYPNLSIAGGEINGLQVLTSSGVPAAVMALVDARELLYADSGDVVFDFAENATIEQDTAPTGDTDMLAAASATLVSTFQTESIAVKYTRHIAWKLRRPDFCAYASNLAIALPSLLAS